MSTAGRIARGALVPAAGFAVLAAARPAGLAVPPPPPAHVRVAAGLSEVDTLRGQLSPAGASPDDVRASVRASVRGGGNAYSRGRIDVSWRDGDVVRYGADLLLRPGFARTLQGQVDLLRWDDYPSAGQRAHRSGVVLFAGDHRAHLVRQRLGVEEAAITAPFDLPEGRWFRLEVRQRLGAGRGARNTVLVDGRVVAHSTRPNAYGNVVQRVRVGVVAVDAERQRRPVTVWFASPFAGPVSRR